MASVHLSHPDDVRETELDAITAIFPELVRADRHSARLDIPVTLAAPVKIKCVAQSGPSLPVSLHDTLSFSTAQQDEAKCTTHDVHNLPGITLFIQLPEGYPFHDPPDTHISMDVPWIPDAKIKELVDASRLLWEDLGRDQAVYALISQLQDDAERCFGLAAEGCLQVPADLAELLVHHNLTLERERFNEETFACSVCLEPKKGRVCHRLQRCGHVFCITCLQDYYNSSILEGDVDNVKCLDPSCSKAKRPRKIRPAELVQIGITDERVQRYTKLRKKRKLEANPNTVYCPRNWCQGPARIASNPDDGISDSDESAASEKEDELIQEAEADVEAGVVADSRSDSDSAFGSRVTDISAKSLAKRAPGDCLAVCTDCSFAFCLICKRSWHGEFGHCSVRNKRIINREEKASQEYIKRYTTPCPSCNARAQKTMGCNHMICRQCSTHFCYLCSSWLSAANPYLHFNTAGSPCYQKLWELDQGDGIGAPARPEPPAIEVIFENSSDDEDDDQEQERLDAALPNIPGPQPNRQRPQNHDQRIRQRTRPRLRRDSAPGHQAGVELRGHGLQRFLQLAARDEEEGWDSDELEEHFIQFVLMDR